MKKKLTFIGPVLTASGYGVHGRQLLAALYATGEFDIAVESLKWGETPFLQDESLQWIRELAAKRHQSPDIAIQLSIPNEFKRRAPLMVGVTAGIEVDRVAPEWLLACNNEVDLVIVPSEHSRRSFIVEYSTQSGEKLHLNKPIFVVPEGVDTAVYKPSSAPSSILDELGVPEKNFVFVGLGLDKAQGRDRKNVSTLVEWFCRAFAGNKNVGLILKTSIVNASRIDYETTKARIAAIKGGVGCGEYPKVFLVHGRLSEPELAGIYNDPRVISSISLTHGEGFGLPLIEAAACGLPVMATDWSGHLDFLTKDGKKLFVPVDHDLKEIYPECVWPGVMNQGTRWAVPKEGDAVTKMQKLVMSSATPRKWAEELAGHVGKTFSLEATGKVFTDLIRQAAAEFAVARPATRESLVSALRGKVRARGPSLVYTMPMSAGDVFLSTSVVRALRQKHPGHVVYFATGAKYMSIVQGLDFIDEVIEWQPWMQDVGILEEIFDEVYTPNLAVQMAWSNWVHRGKGRNLIDEFAVQCGLDPKVLEAPRMFEPAEAVGILPTFLDGDTWLALHTGGQKPARAYAHWTEVVKNIRAAGIKVLQLGAKDDLSVGEVDLDVRGDTAYNDLPTLLKRCKAFLGIDSLPMHVAAAYGLPTVAIFGSSYASSTGPRNFEPLCDADILVRDAEKCVKKVNRLRLIETPSRNGCEKACYKDVCKVDAGNPCINNIDPKDVWLRALLACEVEPKEEYQTYRPKIAGYTHILNPKTHGYPFIQSIESMEGFCDEIIVVDGGSTDGSVQEIEEYFSTVGTKIKVITREWDPDEPGMDGLQKAFGRAMVSPDIEFLWQQDADEVVHEDDAQKVIDICKRFPADVDVVHLPVIELWGDQRHVRTDRHSWKWRLSRNNLRVTHGINAKAKVMDPATGRFYAKKGMSDGCEMIDMVSGEFLPHRGFYNEEIERLRRENPEEYGRVMNGIFGKLPSVWHYSWANLQRKVRNFRDFWDKQWQVLYQTPPEPRFPDVVTDEDVEKKAEELRLRGGEHGNAPTFILDREPPESMRGWA